MNLLLNKTEFENYLCLEYILNKSNFKYTIVGVVCIVRSIATAYRKVTLGNSKSKLLSSILSIKLISELS